MIKYNYTGAAALWKKAMIIVFNPWDFSDVQKDRRFFMHDITRGRKKDIIECIDNNIENYSIEPISNNDILTINELAQLKKEILNFKGVM